MTLWKSVILLLITRKTALWKLLYWCRSEQVYRGLERSLQSCSLKTRALRSLTACLVVRHWAWLCKPYFSWPIHVRKCAFWVRARYFPTFRNTLTTRCLQTCCEFISQIFYLALLLILAVLRSCHFFHASRSCVAVDSQQWQGNVLAPFFHPWHYTNTPTVTVIATWPSPKCKSVSCFLTCWFGILNWLLCWEISQYLTSLQSK